MLAWSHYQERHLPSWLVKAAKENPSLLREGETWYVRLPANTVVSFDVRNFHLLYERLP